MSVSVDEARSCSIALEINDANAGGIASKFQNLCVGTYFHDHATTDGDRLRDRVFSIHSEDASVK